MENNEEYIDLKQLSKNLDNVILEEAKILKKNLENRKKFNINAKLSYV